VEQALEERGNAIADMVSSGMIDIGTAHDLYDRQRAEIYADFQAEQDRVLAQFAADQGAGQLERDSDRAALLAELRAAGVDPALVGDEFAMMDEMYRGAGQEQADYLDAMGRIGRMSDADRGMMGESIFGGYRQDLRSRGRELGLGAEFEATEGRQLARERALQAADLAPYLGVDPRAIASGLYSGVDIPGMTEAARGREWQTGERLGGQEWQTGERLGGQDWRTGERLGSQRFQAGESALDRGFRAGESALDRGFRAGESALDRGFRAGESALGRELSREELAQRASESALAREFQSGQSALDRGFQRGQSALDRTFRRGESALDRAIRESQLDESIRQFGELSAGQQAQQSQWEAGRDLDPESEFYGMTTAQQLDLALRQNAQQGQTRQPFALSLPQVLSSYPNAQQIMQDLRNDLAGQQMSDENIAMALSARGLGDVVTMLSAVSSGIFPEEQETLETVAELTPTEKIAQSRTTGATDLSESERLNPEAVNPNLATGARVQGTRLNPPTARAARGGAHPVYRDMRGQEFTQAQIDAIGAAMPPGWHDEAYEPGPVGYIDFIARRGWVFGPDGRAVEELSAGPRGFRP